MLREVDPEKGAKEMMKETLLNSSSICKVDISQLDSEGSFPCPKCGTQISPDDESEEVYKILDTKVVNDELVELVVSCNTCSTVTRLIGFQQTLEDFSGK
jgi:predicted RNA-binding Zn-ribbon protein involved in translation (DUF1610 family)